MAVFAPEFHVRAEANVDVAKRSMSAIAGTAQERIFAIELLRQQHTVAVERQESILALEELLEIESIADADGGACLWVYPRDSGVHEAHKYFVSTKQLAGARYC